MESSFKIEKEGTVAWLILNRPEKRNSMTLEFFAELREFFRAFDGDPEVRAVVIRAEGTMFTSTDATTASTRDAATSPRRTPHSSPTKT